MHKRLPPYNIISVNDVTASRAFGVTYTNSTGRTIVVNLTIRHVITAADKQALAEIRVDGNIVSNIGIGRSPAMPPSGSINYFSACTFHVKPNSTYVVNSIVSDGGANDINRWIEFN